MSDLSDRANAVAARKEAARLDLDDQLTAFAKHYQISAANLATLGDALHETPAHFRAREFSALLGDEPSQLEYAHRAMPELVDQLMNTLPPGKSKGADRKFRARTLHRWQKAFPVAGQIASTAPAHPHTQLILADAARIVECLDSSPRRKWLRNRDTETPGQRRYHTRPLPFSVDGNGRAGGPAFRLLMSALTHQLPVSGADLSPDTVATIIRQQLKRYLELWRVLNH